MISSNPDPAGCLTCKFARTTQRGMEYCTEHDTYCEIFGNTCGVWTAKAGTPVDAPALECRWTLTADPVDDDCWETDCGKQYLFFEGGPVANGFNGCPFCFRPLVEVRPEPEPEEEEEDA